MIRPGFQGKVDEFGMLIPFPNPPALRKVSDDVFQQLAQTVDPPEVVVHVGVRFSRFQASNGVANRMNMQFDQQAGEKRNKVTVLKQEAVGMYEVAVLEAGSPEALKKWMDLHGYKYPDGMDKVCEEYIEAEWCFVAVKTKVQQKKGVDPRAGQKKVDPNLPSGSTFDGHVQGMGFRFKTDELVVPMRLSAFNDGDMRNVVYLLTDQPKKIRAIPEEYVQRQLTGKQLIANLTQPLPLRIIGGTEKDLTDWHKKNLPQQRDPKPKNGVARQLFASDLHAIATGELSLAHEELEKEYLRIGEHFGLRGPDIDRENNKALSEDAEKATSKSFASLEKMTLTVIDGDFPREVLASRNLTFAQYKMPMRRNNETNYDAKTNGPAPKKQGVLKIGAVDWSHLNSRNPESRRDVQLGINASQIFSFGLLTMSLGIAWVMVNRRRRRVH